MAWCDSHLDALEIVFVRDPPASVLPERVDGQHEQQHQYAESRCPAGCLKHAAGMVIAVARLFEDFEKTHIRLCSPSETAACQGIDRALQNDRSGVAVNLLCPFGSAHVLSDHRVESARGRPPFVP